MRAFATVLLAFALAVAAAGCQQQTEGTAAGGGLLAVTTDASLEAAFSAAKTDGKPVLAIFSAPTWCVWCQKLDKETLTDESVQKELKRFHVVFVDFDKEKELVSKYQVNGVPQTILFDSSGNRVHDIVGFREAPEFLAEIRQAFPEKQSVPLAGAGLGIGSRNSTP